MGLWGIHTERALVQQQQQLQQQQKQQQRCGSGAGAAVCNKHINAINSFARDVEVTNTRVNTENLHILTTSILLRWKKNVT
jgi:transcription initiation factor TFIID subunit TAF12